jgi:hypothetical protein
MHLSSLRRTVSTPHSSRFARLASGAFYLAVLLMTFYEIIKDARWKKVRQESILSYQPICIPHRQVDGKGKETDHSGKAAKPPPPF